MLEPKYSTIISILIYFLVATGLSLLLNQLFLKFSKNLGTRTTKDLIRWESKQKPALGGISFYILFLLSIIVYAYIFNQGSVVFNKQLLGFTLAVSLAFIMGLADDAYNTIPMLKLSAQISCAIILIYFDNCIKIFPFESLNYIVTVLWVVGIMNAINLIDNMDGISTVISIFIIITALTITGFNQGEMGIHYISLLSVLAALIGFLKVNWHPSKMYMGDSGSQFLGVFLAALGITYFWNYSPPIEMGLHENKDLLSISLNCLLVLIVFCIPIADTTSVFINRIRKGKSPMIGGRDHTTHHLYYLGLSEKQIAWSFMCISLIALLMVTYIAVIQPIWNYLHIVLYALFFLTVFLSLFYVTLRPSKSNEGEENKNE